MSTTSKRTTSHAAVSWFVTAASEGGILPRILDAIFESHERQADREIIPFVAESGEAFTDGIEREITQRALMGNSSPRW